MRIRPKLLRTMMRMTMSDYRHLTLTELAELLRGGVDTLVIFHRHPDGDAIGSGFGLRLLLEAMGCKVLCACDLSGRDYLGWAVTLPAPKVGDFDTELAKEFWLGFVRNCPASIHIRELCGENTHHILEAVFKGMGRCLKEAVALDPKHLGEVPSTKGVL